MTRKMLTATLVVAALLLSVLSIGSLSAEARQPDCPYYDAQVTNRCAPALAYPGPFQTMPPGPVGPYGWGKLNIVAGAGAVVGGGDAGGTGGGLAHTGSEST